jgi:hypothetical protein
VSFLAPSPLVLLGYPMSNSGSLGTATAEPATMKQVSLGHEEIMDSKGKDRESGSKQMATFPMCCYANSSPVVNPFCSPS